MQKEYSYILYICVVILSTSVKRLRRFILWKEIPQSLSKWMERDQS